MPLKLKGKIQPNGTDRRYYMIRVQVNGRREVFSTGHKDRVLAEKQEAVVVEALRNNPDIAKEDLIAIMHGDRKLAARAQARSKMGMTLQDGFKRCFEDTSGWLMIRSKDTYTLNCRKVEEILGPTLPIAQIDVDELERFVHKCLGAGLKNATINRRLACIGKMLDLAVNKWKVLRHSPKMPYLKEGGTRTFVFEPDQEATLFQAVRDLQDEPPSKYGGHPRKQDSEAIHALLVVLVETGMRLGEAIRLQWEDVLFRNNQSTSSIRLWRIDEQKNRTPREIPMTGACYEMLKSRVGTPVGPFWGLKKRRVQEVWAKAKKKAGIKHKDCVIHSLRHTCATRLLEAIGDIKLVQEWLGHTTVVTTSKTYAHVRTRRMVIAAEALSRFREEDNPAARVT